ncbi:hypothetical protein AV530_004680 [Patagioenas fasciata monilis]|uniref:Uncharacterized protein n=1 Tax=Patagioenas fasciata monilis TaxID=372326 RepID=A0A1V4KJK9_PATFA|nr:hypothetical protein AV530_004680 [Patagioenas fasciata monilis]
MRCRFLPLKKTFKSPTVTEVLPGQEWTTELSHIDLNAESWLEDGEFQIDGGTGFQLWVLPIGRPVL